jgi:hypothetical protein
MFRARLAYLRVFRVSASFVSAGDMHAIIRVRLRGERAMINDSSQTYKQSRKLIMAPKRLISKEFVE